MEIFASLTPNPNASWKTVAANINKPWDYASLTPNPNASWEFIVNNVVVMETKFLNAVREGFMRDVKFYLKKKNVSINMLGNGEASRIATKNNDRNMLAMLHEHGDNLEGCLAIAAANGNTNLVKYLFPYAAKAEVDSVYEFVCQRLHADAQVNLSLMDFFKSHVYDYWSS